MIDKAATHLATKPPELAKHILENDKEGKFSFLKEGDPYHAYYLFKFNEAKEGRGTIKMTLYIKCSLIFIIAQPAEVAPGPTAQVVMDTPVDLAPKKPEDFLFSATMPAMSAQDL